METSPAAVHIDDPWLRRGRAMWAGALFLLVLGIRLWLIGRYGSDLPFWDQWDAEAAQVFTPYFSGTLGVEHWFAAHNEHRIPFTRLLSFALMSAGGQWDARVQMVVNAFIAAAVSAMLYLMAARAAGRVQALILGVCFAVLFALPYGWENTLAGFQSQFYLLVGSSLVALYLLPAARPLSRGWIGGALAAVAALFCMGSGLVAAAAVIAVFSVVVLRRRRDWRAVLRETAPTAGVCVVLIAAGMLLRVEVPSHESLRAQSVTEYADSLIRYLAWPWTSVPLWGLAAWLPLLAFVVAYVRGRVEDRREERFVLALAAWTVLQAAALAHSRAGGYETARYGDILVFAVFVNGLAMIPLATTRSIPRAAVMVAFAGWLVISVTGIVRISLDGSVSGRAFEYAFQRRNVAAFVETGDLSSLRPPPPARDFNAIPYPDAERLAALLLDERIRGILPASVQPRPVLSRIRGTPQRAAVADWRPGSAPDFWEPVGRFAPDDPARSGEFAFGAEKRAGRPLLLFFARGSVTSVTVGAAGGAHAPPTVLRSQDDRGWRPVLARCPAPRCVVQGAPGAEGAEFTEPREVGWLSAAAFVAAWEAWLVILAGVLVAGAAAAAVLLRPRPVAVPGKPDAAREPDGELA